MSESLSRRSFLRGAGVVAASAAIGGRIRPARAAAPTVAVFGGGVAGLTVAHELAERGFDVTVYERREWGGKARSMEGTARPGGDGLPAEHGYRMCVAGYQNLPDTMRRIPFSVNRDGVYGNLVTLPTVLLSRDEVRRPCTLPMGSLEPQAMTPAEFVNAFLALYDWLPPADVARAVSRMAVFFASSPARRFGEWEYQTWARFMQADQMSEGARKVFVNFPTRFAAQTLDGMTSARTLGQVAETCLYPVVTARDATRVLDAPTNEAWIDPWLAHVRRLGVRLRLGYKVTALHMANGAIDHARVRGPEGTGAVHADWYVMALPVEWATKLWTPEILAADPQLARSANITTGWMTGVQMYLRERTPLTEGAVVCLDSPWAVSGISQAQFWRRDFAASYGHGTVADKFSAVICDWDTPGILFGKPARACTRAEIGAEIWAQLQRHFEYQGAPPLPDSLLAGTFVDPGIQWESDRIVGNDDPLPRCNPGTWDDRPPVAGPIPNLFRAGDWVKTDFDMTSMEGANEAARRAVNAVLDRSGSRESHVHVFDRFMPPEWAALRALDARRSARGQRNILDADLDVDRLRALLGAA